MMTRGTVTVSIVSHGHGALLPGLLSDLSACPAVAKVILTRNIPDTYVNICRAGWMSVIDNSSPKGFGENHNMAYKQVQTPYFVVLNPDVRFQGDPFPGLLSCLEQNSAAICAPAVTNPSGGLEDSARYFPSPRDLIGKLFGGHDGRLRYSLGDPAMPAPWVAGMFMLIRRAEFAEIGGFDEGFFLYYEDVDLCARMWSHKHRVILCPKICVVHDARRASRRDLMHMYWHATSMMRYFRKHLMRNKTDII